MLRIFRHYVSATLLLLVLLDVAVIVTVVALSGALAPWAEQGPLWSKAAVLSVLVVFALYLADLYEPHRQLGHRELIMRLFLSLAPAGLVAAALASAAPTFRLSQLTVVLTSGLFAIGLFLSRSVWNRVQWTEPLHERVLVIGVNRSAESIVALQSTGSRPFTVLGFLDDSPGAPDLLPSGSPLLGKTKDLLSFVEELHPDCVVVALAEMRTSFPANDLLDCRLRGIRVERWPTFHEQRTGKILLAELHATWLIFSDGFVQTRLTQIGKRVMDLILATVGLFGCLPVMGLVALAIRLDSKGPVFFRQDRVGRNGRVFTLYKFRSMHATAEEQSGAVWASPSDPRITHVGRILRRTRLDELPQLFNVLSGDMSFIGPRPERPEFVRILMQEIPFCMQRLSVKPGITGWAQVSHQYAASLDESVEKLQFDFYYIKNLSVFLDLVILLHTIPVVLFGRGAR